MLRPVHVFVLLALLPAAASAGPSLTLYTSDLGLVKESRNLDYRGTRDTLRLEGVSNRLDATSLRFVPSSGKLSRLAYRYDVATGDGLLERAIGSRVRVVSRNNERVTEGTLLSADGAWLVVRGDDGALSTLYREAMQEIRLAKPDAGLSLKPAIEAVVEGAKRGGGTAELQYLTGGLSWGAEHTLVRTGETSAQWSAVVRVENTTGRDYRDANVKLIAGEVSRAGAPRPVEEMTRAMKAQAFMAADAGGAPSEQAFSDFHLYTLPGLVTLRDRESQTLVLLEPKTVAVKPLYVYRGGNASGVQWKLEMVNSAKEGTGAPLPAGRMRCYAPDGDKDLQLTGETTVRHTAVDEKVTLEMGYAFDLVAERKQVSERRVSDREREYSVEIKLRNRKSVDATIQVEEPANGETDVIKSSIPVKRDEANLLKFTVPVAAGKEVVLTYTARQRW
ncbi:MAG TPA: DUF4139 domain-containing protein [Methylomirabilota bacterium]|jgi:hypothetical protein|nr:DUF4139 domain-containing protein [Methylomirabilota bacterium]